MSQQMPYDEEQSRGYRPQYSPNPEGDQRVEYHHDPFVGSMAGQKLRVEPGGRLSSGQRLALAIVSVAMLVPLAAIILGSVSDAAAGGAFVLASRMIALGVVCLTIVAINFSVNFRR